LEDTEFRFLNEKLKKLRKARGWEQSDVADKIGVATSGISDIERGKTMPRRR